MQSACPEQSNSCISVFVALLSADNCIVLCYFPKIKLSTKISTKNNKCEDINYGKQMVKEVHLIFFLRTNHPKAEDLLSQGRAGRGAVVLLHWNWFFV